MATQALLLLLLGCVPLLAAAQSVDATTNAVQPSATDVGDRSGNNIVVTVLNPTTASAFLGQTVTFQVSACALYEETCPAAPIGNCSKSCNPGTVGIELEGVGNLIGDGFVNVTARAGLVENAASQRVDLDFVNLGEGGLARLASPPTRQRKQIVIGFSNGSTIGRTEDEVVRVTWVDSIGEVLLLPRKAVRHVHQPVTVTAVVLASNRLPLSGVTVAFSMFGNRHPMPQLQLAVAVTDDKGWATTTVRSAAPGSISIVATAQVPNGTMLESAATHLEFVGHEYGSREGSYGDGGHYPH